MTPIIPDFKSVARVRSAIANAAGYRVVSQIAGAVTYVLLVRILSEYDYGVYKLFYSIPAAMGAVLSLGIGNALLRFLPEYFANRNFGLARHFVSWALRLRLLTTSSFLLLCLILWDQISPIFEVAHLKSYFIIFIGITLTHFQCRILLIALSANLMQQWSSGLSAGFALIKLAGYFLAAFAGVSLELVLIVDLAAYLIWYVSLRFAYHTRIPRPDNPAPVRFPRDERKRVVRYAAFYNFNDVGVMALGPSADRLFIAAFMSPVAVGAYAFCTGLNAMVQKLLPVSFFNGVIEPLIFTLDHEKQKSRARSYFQFLVKINYLVQFPILVLVASVPAQIISVVFGGKFIEYQFLLVAVFAFPAMYSFQVPVTIMAQLRERAGIILASKIFAVYNVIAALALIPIYGAYGAMLATGTAQLFKCFFIWFFVRDLASFRGTGRFFLVQVTLWLACWTVVRFATRDVGDVWALVSAIAIVGIFSILGVRLAHFDLQDSNLIRKLSGRRATRILEATGIIRS